MKRVIGLDVGSVRIGVAISDPTGAFAQPLEVILRKKTPAIERIVHLIGTYEATQIVVGKPLRLNGDEGPAVVAIAKFVSALQKHTSIRLDWWDERLTTRAAERTMLHLGARRQTRCDNIDKVAAAIILQGYLDAQCPVTQE